MIRFQGIYSKKEKEKEKEHSNTNNEGDEINSNEHSQDHDRPFTDARHRFTTRNAHVYATSSSCPRLSTKTRQQR
jgi:ABC-type Zn2+ transport system substrate-binding protein/surface adhesin